MRIVAAVVAALMTSSAWAQSKTAPVLSVPEDAISMSVGQAQKLSFPTVFDRVELTTDTVVQAKPLTDRVLTLHGLAAGETLMTVFAGGQELYSATIIVSAEPGHLVRMYGNGKSDDVNAGHTAVFCNNVGCGRPDKDMPRPSVEVRRITTGGKIDRQ